LEKGYGEGGRSSKLNTPSGRVTGSGKGEKRKIEQRGKARGLSSEKGKGFAANYRKNRGFTEQITRGEGDMKDKKAGECLELIYSRQDEKSSLRKETRRRFQDGEEPAHP